MNRPSCVVIGLFPFDTANILQIFYPPKLFAKKIAKSAKNLILPLKTPPFRTPEPPQRHIPPSPTQQESANKNPPTIQLTEKGKDNAIIGNATTGNATTQNKSPHRGDLPILRVLHKPTAYVHNAHGWTQYEDDNHVLHLHPFESSRTSDPNVHNILYM